MPEKTLDQWLESSSEDETPRRSSSFTSTSRRGSSPPFQQQTTHVLGSNVTASQDTGASSSRASTPDRGVKSSGTPKLVRRSAADASTAPSAASIAANAERLKRMQAMEERRKQQEELAKRMEAALGTNAVKAVETNLAAKKAEQQPVSTTSSADLGLPPTAPTHGGDSPSVKSKKAGFQQMEEGLDGEEPYGIMVADRGCQTLRQDDQGCQTDPIVTCPHCHGQSYATYEPQYPGAAPYPFYAPLATQFTRGPPAPGIGYNYAPHMYGSGGTTSPHHPPSSSAAVPQHHFHSGSPYMPGSAALPSRAGLKMQLDFVTKAVDNIITKYNLPPPPRI